MSQHAGADTDGLAVPDPPGTDAVAGDAVASYPPTDALEIGALDTDALDALVRAHVLHGWEGDVPEHERPQITTAYAPISSRELIAAFTVVAHIDEGICPDGDIVEARVHVARVALGPAGWTLARALRLEVDEWAGAEPCELRLGELEAGDWNRDGVADASLTVRVMTLDGYSEVDTSRWYVVETGDPMRVVLDEDYGVSTAVLTPGCYEGDDDAVEDVFGVLRNDSVTHVWNDRGASRPYEVRLTLESTLRRCAEEIEPLHARGPNGSCISNRELAWSSVMRRWVPFRGFAPAGYILLAASGHNRAALERRARSLTDLPPGMHAAVMRSDDVRGLRPGFHVLLFGACEDRADALAARDRLPPETRRGVLPRPVLELPPSLPCPIP